MLFGPLPDFPDEDLVLQLSYAELVAKIGKRLYPIDFVCDRLPPALWPTQAKPGTTGKVRVMAYRYSRCQELFHPGDARDADDEARRIRVLRNGRILMFGIFCERGQSA